MTVDLLDRRVLGAVRFVDAATATPIQARLTVQGAEAHLVRNRSGWYVIHAAPGLAAHTAAFEMPPTVPALGSVALELTVSDPAGAYLARRCTVRLPRDADPASAAQPDSLFTPVDVALYPSPVARTAMGWAVVRATVTENGTARRLPGALLRAVRTADGSRLGAGVSDSRGETLVAVPGIPITTWEEGPGPVMATEIDVTIEAVFDPNADANDLPDPDDLEARRSDLPSAAVEVRLAAGREVVRAIAVALP